MFGGTHSAAARAARSEESTIATSTDRRAHGSAEPRSGQRDTIEAVLHDVVGSDADLHPPGMSPAKAAVSLLAQPGRVARRGMALVGELGQIVAGRSDVSPEKGDKRFKDTAWEHNPALHRLMQAYVATGEAIDGVITEADLDWRSEQRLRFAAGNLLEALAPSNFPLTNPTVLKAAIDSGGLHFVQGLRNLVHDLRSGGMPTTVDRSAFTVGENLAVTPGSVVARTEVFELIQYDPQTDEVHEAPLLLVPQMINKYYISDLAPGKSVLEYAVTQGHQVFTMSWRNPDARHADWNLDTYCQAVLEALYTVEEITGTSRTHLMGLCAGGNLAAMVLAHLAAIGEQDRIAGLVLSVTVLDWEAAGTHGALLDRAAAAAAMAESARKGYLDGARLASLFSFLRPTDMIWNFWINNYLLGQDPPAWDVLYWNQDQTNMSAALHRDFVQLGLENPLVRPGALTVLDTSVDLSAVTVDSYVVGAVADHIAPWKNVYRTTQLLGSEPTFVLSTSGHVVATVNPPENSSASFKTNSDNPSDPEDWLAGTSETEGSWWPHWAAWLGERSGARKQAPREPGSADFPALGKAPGDYVRETT